MPEHKRCPQCAEEVLAEARVCRHCGHSFQFNTPAVKVVKVLLVVAFSVLVTALLVEMMYGT